MRINMPMWLIGIAALPLVACSSDQDVSHKFVSGYATVDELFWPANHNTPYPFTTSGEISCVYYPDFGIEVYFEPVGHIEDWSIGTPLNKAAQMALEKAEMTPNVPYSIKEGADLSEARDVGLELCNEQKAMIEASH